MNGQQTNRLADMNCVACAGGEPQLTGEDLRRIAGHVPGWEVVRSHHIARTFEFPDFRRALEFVDEVGAIAEQQSHHPDLEISWGRVGVKVYTHKVQGLTESDFILAAKIDRAYALRASSNGR